MLVRSKSSSIWRATPSAVATAARGGQLLRVALAVVDGERKQRKSVTLRHRRRGIRIEATAQQDDGL